MGKLKWAWALMALTSTFTITAIIGSIFKIHVKLDDLHIVVLIGLYITYAAMTIRDAIIEKE